MMFSFFPETAWVASKIGSVVCHRLEHMDAICKADSGQVGGRIAGQKRQTDSLIRYMATICKADSMCQKQNCQTSRGGKTLWMEYFNAIFKPQSDVPEVESSEARKTAYWSILTTDSTTGQKTSHWRGKRRATMLEIFDHRTQRRARSRLTGGKKGRRLARAFDAAPTRATTHLK